MNLTKAQILNAAMKLSSDERIDLADELFASLTPDEQAEIDKAWIEEAESRLDALNRGEMQDFPGEQTLDDLEAKYRK